MTENKRCGAKSRRTGGLCQNYAMRNGRCRMHGGKTPSGIASPHFKTGQHSKYLPKHLKADYDRLSKDAKLLSVRSDVALITARALELTKQLDSEPPPWGKVVDLLVSCEQEQGDDFKAAFASLAKAVREGMDKTERYEKTWAELRQIMLEKAKLTQAEHKRLEVLGGLLKLDDVLAVLCRLLEAVRIHVQDMDARQAIQAEFDEIIDARSQAVAEIPLAKEAQ